IAAAVRRHRRALLVLVGDGVDAELAALGDARGVVALGEDVPAVAAGLDVTLPDDEEAAARTHADDGIGLVALGEGVDAELAALGAARGGVALGVDVPAVAAGLVMALPDDDEVVGGVHRDGGVHLVILGAGVDAELAALRSAGRVVALGVDAPAAAVL